MCTYHIALDDALLERAKLAFKNEQEMSSWMQEQVESLLLQVATRAEHRPNTNIRLSQRLRGIAKAPEGFDYKKELEARF